MTLVSTQKVSADLEGSVTYWKDTDRNERINGWITGFHVCLFGYSNGLVFKTDCEAYHDTDPHKHATILFIYFEA